MARFRRGAGGALHAASTTALSEKRRRLLPARSRHYGERIDYVGFYEKPLRKFDRIVETYATFAPRAYALISRRCRRG